MNIVIIESPYAGNVDRNLKYARAAMRDCLQRGEAPYASHLLYTQDGVYDDNDPIERSRGMRAGWAFVKVADIIAVYEDLGISEGMKSGIQAHINAGFDEEKIEYRSLGSEWDS